MELANEDDDNKRYVKIQFSGLTPHLSAPSKYGSGNGLPLVTSSDATNTSGTGTSAIESAEVA